MITGQDLKLECVKFQNHKKTDEKLEELIYKMNDILYFFSRKIINVKAKNYILSEFEKIGTTAKDLEDSPRKDEMLTALRHFYKVVRNADIKPSTTADIDDYMKLKNYAVAKSIKAKTQLQDVILKQLEENRMIYDLYLKPFQNAIGKDINIMNFTKIQKELLQMIGKKYDFDYGD